MAVGVLGGIGLGGAEFRLPLLIMLFGFAAFAQVRTLRHTDLETLRLVTTHQGRIVPTLGGILLFGLDRERHFPGAWIQVGRFYGTDKSRIIDHVEIRTHLVRAAEEAIAFVHKHGLHGAEIGPVRRTEVWSIPPIAVREAIIDAVAHADYRQRGAPIRVAIFDDRLEVENPGLLPFGLTVEDLHRGVSKLRNRVIGRVLHALGLSPTPTTACPPARSPRLSH